VHTIDAEEAAGDELELEEGAESNLRLAVEVAVVDGDAAVHRDAGHLLQGVLVVALVEQVPSVEEDKAFLPAGVACGFGCIGEDVLNLLINVLDLLIDLAQPWSEKDGSVGGKDRLVKGCVAIDALVAARLEISGRADFWKHGDEDRLHGVGERGEAIGEFLPLVEVATVDGIAVGDAFVLSAETDGEEAVVVADLDDEDFGFAKFDPVERREVGEFGALRRVEGCLYFQNRPRLSRSVNHCSGLLLLFRSNSRTRFLMASTIWSEIRPTQNETSTKSGTTLKASQMHK
jgi:hypothetical protein